MGVTLSSRCRQFRNGTWVAECVELGCRALGRDQAEAMRHLKELVEFEMSDDLTKADGAMRPDDLMPFEVDLPPENEGDQDE